jgi:hypothetical protein
VSWNFISLAFESYAMRTLISIVFLCLPFFCKSQYYFGTRAGLEAFSDKTNSGFGNIYTGVFLEKAKGIYFSPYFNLGYVPEMSFGSGTFSFMAFEPGTALCFQSKFVGLRLDASFYQFLSTRRIGFESGGETMFLPSIGIRTGRVFKIVDAGVFIGNSLYTGDQKWEDLANGYIKVGWDISFFIGKGIEL